MTRPATSPSIWPDSPERYGLVSRAFHWGMACLLIWQFAGLLGWKVFQDSATFKAIMALGPYHGTVGLLTIVLVVMRAAWALVQRKRRPSHGAGWQGRLAGSAHASFYLLMFLIPGLALLRSYGNGKGYVSWGIEIIPATGREIAWMMAPANALHSVLAWGLCVLIVGHIAMALHHSLVRRDGLLGRMAGRLGQFQMRPQTSAADAATRS